MPYTMTDYMRDYVITYFPVLTPDEKNEVLESIQVEERMKGISTEKLLEGISIYELLKWFTVEKFLKILSDAEKKEFFKVLTEYETDKEI
ncbi:hypothetical protein QUF70_03175 [Desulfobacterales bacterium HSG17]|nr:hypothetical protein [Desulfobacterales bacterium HSG17]